MIPQWLRWSALTLTGFVAVLVATGAAPAGGSEVVAVADRAVPTLANSSLAPPKYERDVARKVAQLLSQAHYSGRAVDDELSRRWLGNYIDRLDYERTIFLQSDIDRFRNKYETSLDEAISGRNPNVESAVVIYETYRQRMRNRVAAARATLAGEIDVTDDESYPINRHDTVQSWPETKEEANSFWRKRVENELIVGLLDGEPREKVLDLLAKRYDRLENMLEDRESTDVMQAWLGALGAAFDPHSVWFAPARNDDFDISITNSVTGIGAQLVTEGDYIVVKELIAGGPAKKSKQVQQEDKILAVAQGDEEPVDVVGLRIDKVVRLIRGEVGTVVRLLVQHADGERAEIEMVRERVTLEDTAAKHEVIDLEDHRYGVVKLPSFYVSRDGRRGTRSASGDVKASLDALRKEGAEGLVLDLRGNGGGSLNEAIDVTGLFISRGPVVQVRTRDGSIEVLPDLDPRVHWLRPMVVLVDPPSASASEIVAGALQDYGRALVVGGKQTHGKGTVQQVAPLTSMLPGRHTEDVGGALKLTIQKFYRVNGGSTQNKGVLSDVVLPTPWDGLDVFERDLDYALDWDQIPPAPHFRVDDLSDLVPKLQRRSAKRVAKSEDFGELQELIDDRTAMQARESVSLVFDVRKAEFEERKARFGDKTKPPAEAIGGGDSDEPEEDDYILDEAVAVLHDMIELSREPAK